MNPETVFSLANLLALAGWVALAALPGRRWVADVLCGTLLPAALAAAYVALVLGTWGAAQGGFSSLADVARLFESRWLLLAGWVHYLAFDLFVGSWIARDARRRGVRHVWCLPCLALTFLFGPAGWLSYLAVRAVAVRRARGKTLPARATLHDGPACDAGLLPGKGTPPGHLAGPPHTAPQPPLPRGAAGCRGVGLRGYRVGCPEGCGACA